MTQTTTQDPQPQESVGAELDAVDEQLAARLVAQARERGISLVGPDGLLQRVTKLVLEGALEGELADHLGYQSGDPAGRNGGNSAGRHPRQDRADRHRPGPAGGAPRPRRQLPATIVRKRQRRLEGVEDLVVSLVAKGLTTGEVAAHLAEVYGTRGLPADHLHHHRPGAGGPCGLAEPAAGSGLPGAVHRRDQRQDPRRAGL